jgi:hypothetical protein
MAGVGVFNCLTAQTLNCFCLKPSTALTSTPRPNYPDCGDVKLGRVMEFFSDVGGENWWGKAGEKQT